MTNPFSEFEGAENVDTNTRSPTPDYGSHDVTIEAIRYHQGLGGNGVKVSYIMPDGAVRGHYISLKKDPRYAINYGVRDTKILIGACQGWGEADDRTKAIDNATIQRYMGPDQPGAGKRVHLEVSKGKPDPKHPGEFFCNVKIFPVAQAGGAVASPAAPAASPTPAPSAPVAPPAASKVPAGWLPNPNAPGWFYNPADVSAAQVQG